ncbi:MAG: RNA-binding protein [Pseudanabaena sp.]|nr:MAG: RNA-binding protein [Pseudanabaena sp.]
MEDNLVGVSWLQELLSLMGYRATVDSKFIESSAVEKSSQNYWLEINPSQLQQQQIDRLLGHDGSVIDALQYLATLSLNKNFYSDSQDLINFYTIDLNGYRSEKLARLQDMADNAVKNVRETKAEFVIKHLSSSDRRHIHQILEDVADVETVSQGKEPNRHLIVKLVQP